MSTVYGIENRRMWKRAVELPCRVSCECGAFFVEIPYLPAILSHPESHMPTSQTCEVWDAAGAFSHHRDWCAWCPDQTARGRSYTGLSSLSLDMWLLGARSGSKFFQLGKRCNHEWWLRVLFYGNFSLCSHTSICWSHIGSSSPGRCDSIAECSKAGCFRECWNHPGSEHSLGWN